MRNGFLLFQLENCCILSFKRTRYALLLLLISGLVLIASSCAPATAHIVENQPFEPKKDSRLEGGVYHISSMKISPDIDLHFNSDVSITIEGDMEVSGNISADCAAMDFDVGGNLTLNGIIDNQCSDETSQGPNITIHAQGDGFSLGNAAAPVHINSNGDITIIAGPKRPDWEYEIHPDARPSSNLPPVCTVQADNALVFLQDGSASLGFTAKGIDPDGGEVAFQWDFGDGGNASGQNPVHDYSVPGNYLVQLYGNDDDGSACQEQLTISVVDPLEDDLSRKLGAFIQTPSLTAEQFSPVTFHAFVDDFLDGEIGYLWRADSQVSEEADPVFSFDQPGRYDITLIVSDLQGMGVEARATSSIYILPQELKVSTASRLAKSKPPQIKHNCGSPAWNVIAIAPVLTGNWVRLEYWPLFSDAHLMLLPATSITARDGASYPTPASGQGNIYGQNGGNGASIVVRNFVGDITLCGGAQFIPGNGGNGQAADSSNNPASQDALARGGNGGLPGGIHFLVSPLNKIYVQAFAPTINIFFSPGNGGNGADALAVGGNGANSCQSPGKGGEAKAIGGKGGSASYVLTCPNSMVFEAGGNILVRNSGAKTGSAGNGGSAVAIAGNGGGVLDTKGKPCVNAECINGASGGRAFAQSGNGGSAILTSRCAAANTAFFNGGNGGLVRAEGGKGGRAADCPKQAKGGQGGKGGDAQEIIGKLGSGNPGTDGNAGGQFIGTIIGIIDRFPANRGTGSGGDGGGGGDGVQEGGKGGAGGSGSGVGVSKGNLGLGGIKIIQTPAVEETAEPMAGGSGPEIVSIEFPLGKSLNLEEILLIRIPADNSVVSGKITFSDPDGNTSYVFFKPLDEVSPFNSFGFYLNDLNEGELQGDLFFGEFEFWLQCGQYGVYSLGIAMQDSAGNWGEWRVLQLKCI